MSLKLAAGDFTKKVVFKKPTTVKNNEGGSEKTFANTLTTWAAETKWDQRRLMEAGKTDLLNTRMIYIRYAANRAEIDKDWLVEIDGKDHVIFSKPVLIESGLKVFEMQVKVK